MDDFDTRLAAARLALALVLAGCTGVTPKEETATGETGTPVPTTPSAMCSGASLPSGFVITSGYVEVLPGDDCPPATAAQAVESDQCCPGLDWQETCAFVTRLSNMTTTGYYGYWTQGTSGGVELCEYTAVFEENGSCCGRPLLVDGRPLVAPIRSDGAWDAGLRPDASGLAPAERARVAAYWLAAARLEHASVASFAKFALELLRLGAPPALLADAQRAGLDEVRHAEACFALASAYLGERVGPAEIDLDRLSLAASPADTALALVREGCIGETLAALDAAARRAVATDPAVRATLATIEEDEARHAALAWRTLRWLLARDADGSVRARVAPLFDRPPADPDDRDATPAERAHGVLSSAARQRTVAMAWERVIRPSWTATSSRAS